jgi:hypothetical protein
MLESVKKLNSGDKTSSPLSPSVDSAGGIGIDIILFIEDRWKGVGIGKYWCKMQRIALVLVQILVHACAASCWREGASPRGTYFGGKKGT